jgi:hypothetical protein
VSSGVIPAQAGIQYAAAIVSKGPQGLLDHPLEFILAKAGTDDDS